MSRLRAGGCALAVVLVLLGVWFSPASSAVTQTANVVARVHGKVLPADPLLVAGEQVQLTITGFAPGARVTVRLGGLSLGAYSADKNGTVKFTFKIPSGLGKGEFVVAAVGSPSLRSVTPTPAKTGSTIDPQVVEAFVPTIGLFVFHLDPGHGSTSPTPPPTSPTHHSSTSHGGGNSGGLGGSGGTGGNPGGLGQTGVDVSILLLVAAGALVLGWVIMLPGRRRKHP